MILGCCQRVDMEEQKKYTIDNKYLFTIKNLKNVFYIEYTNGILLLSEILVSAASWAREHR